MNTTNASTRRRLALGATIVALTLTTGCNDEQRRDLGEVDTRDVLAGRLEQEVDDHGLELDGDLDCTSDIADDSAATASCSGTATSGVAVVGSFTGTADVDAETCVARLVIDIDGETVVDEPDADCFDVS